MRWQFPKQFALFSSLYWTSLFSTQFICSAASFKGDIYIIIHTYTIITYPQHEINYKTCNNLFLLFHSSLFIFFSLEEQAITQSSVLFKFHVITVFLLTVPMPFTAIELPSVLAVYNFTACVLLHSHSCYIRSCLK
jgi:hypothetical protein